MGAKSLVDTGSEQEGHRVRGRIRLLAFFLGVIGLFSEGLRMQLAGQVFDGGNDARRGTVYRVTDHRVAVIANGTENLPPREPCEPGHLAGGVSGMRLGKYQKIRLQTRSEEHTSELQSRLH